MQHFNNCIMSEVKASQPIHWNRLYFLLRKLALSFSFLHNPSTSTVLPFVIFCCHGCRERQCSMKIRNGGVAAHGRLLTYSKHPAHVLTQQSKSTVLGLRHPLTHTTLSQLKSKHLINIFSWHTSSLYILNHVSSYKASSPLPHKDVKLRYLSMHILCY